jgi:hypothetical protein
MNQRQQQSNYFMFVPSTPLPHKPRLKCFANVANTKYYLALVLKIL